MTLIRRYTSLSAEGEFNGTLGVAKTSAANKDLAMFKKKYATTFQKSYAGKVWSTGVSFKFFSVGKKPAIAINCAPSKLSEDDWVDFSALLATMFPYGAKQVWKVFRLARLEVAMDVRVPFSDLVCLVPKVSVVNLKYLSDGTLYLGQRYGNRSFCIYDKRKQLAEKCDVDLGHNATRIEVRLRNTGKVLGQLGEFGYPFGNLLVLRKSALCKLVEKHPSSNELKAFVEVVLEGGIAQQAYLDMAPYSRKLLLKLLRPAAFKLSGEAKSWGKWFAEQQSALEARFLADD